ncbi:MAG: nucleic acid-binding protein [Candidatus Thermoplasmatota archaeon]|nr:nucleic acid-binding protein [Euryarchaeota archaeon]MBU4031321.1 nucleic acid-binding protein [Candidatus Thermoplasmatota archaeon]MBU4071722.1 nucleic acid-binding protein [Candidatus Thermoplasmatota archaeon]MBU4143913.1 nucleic acid-binding protein [Candidatus Thermoplasmatota archaeon]MBU4591665.1 nucleic acid-binding protein [Candidatus Thermoplasmatota archaeon]
MPYVLDATAIRSCMPTQDPSQYFTTPGVINEVKRGKVARDLELALEISITVKMPEPEALKVVMAAASGTGDDGRLSVTDMEILALALELKATIISDDYSVQNVATVLEIPYKTALEGIRKVIHWTYRCRGCGRYYEEKQPDCPICGSEVRTVRRKDL